MKQDTTMDPYHLFSINNSAFTSIVATYMTYIVVMIQFKTAELPLKAWKEQTKLLKNIWIKCNKNK